jgi:hypothetical protein
MLSRTAIHMSIKTVSGAFLPSRFLNIRCCPVLQSLMHEFFTIENEIILRQQLLLFLRDRPDGFSEVIGERAS